jgi:hypothetical protein
MTLDTNFSTSPYFDDYSVTKNYYRVLYKPSVAVQARELNQVQSIFQNQIEQFGKNIFKDGSVVSGCAFTYDNTYNYVKINDNYANNFAIPNVSSFVGLNIVNPNGLMGKIVNAIQGYQSQAPDLNTLYIKYINSSVYGNGSVQSTFGNNESLSITTSANAYIGNVTVATISNSTGSGYAFTTTAGVIFKKGFFLSVSPQTIVVTKYNNVPDGVSVGFSALETIITSNIDTSLLDNAAGSLNYSAPGADRLMITPKLVTKNANGFVSLATDIANTQTFFSLCDFTNGLPVSVKNTPQYAAIGADMARRTYETNGDYVVTPFVLSTQIKTDISGNANTNYISLVSSAGVGYSKGYRVEFINTNLVDLRKGVDLANVASQIVTTNFGNYFNIKEYCGDFHNNTISQVELHNIAKTALTSKTFLSTGYSTTTKIGTAYVRGVQYNTGIPGVNTATYLLYVFNVQMLPGASISQVKSIISYNAGVQGVADIILTPSSGNVSIAVIQSPSSELMVYPFGQKALSINGFSTEQFIYRGHANSTIAANGSMSITLPAASGTGVENFFYQGTLSTNLEETFIVVPTSNGYSSNNNGTISSSGNTVTGVSTTFTSSYVSGDYIYSNAQTNQIIAIANDTSLTTITAFSAIVSGNTHQTIYPAGVPLDFLPLNRTILTATNVATLNLNKTANAVFPCSIYFDVIRSSTAPIKKNINKSSLIQINVGNNAGGTSGPWSLGLPDVMILNHVWVGNGTYANTNPDLLSSFTLDNGQRDGFYNIATLKPNGPIANNLTILVSVDVFTKDETQGHGYFSAASYPIDDANTANTTAIQTIKIPVYISSVNTPSDLRDSVDFRPYVSNTANVVSTATSWTLTNVTTNPVTTNIINVPSQGSYLPSPNMFYQGNIRYYLPRTDRVVINTSGQMLIVRGVAANNPIPPLELPGTMTIGIVNVSPYPSLTSIEAKINNRYDYATAVTMQQTKRFTMADIGKMAKRIDNLEYYTSLSLLEQSAQSLQITSGTTGQNRFKNGILVDPFRDFTISNTNDPTYRIAIDTGVNQARPYFTQHNIPMVYDATQSSNITKTGDIITLPYTSSVFQKQPYSSQFRNCIEGNVYNFRGSLTLDPAGSVEPDLTVGPTVVSNLDLSANFVNLQKYLATASGTQWGNWVTTDSQSSSSTSSPGLIGSVTNPDGSISQTFQTATTTTTSSKLHSLGTQLVATPSSTTVNLGNFVTNVSILPFIKSASVFFKAVGMKPSTKLYAYFNNVPVSNSCMPMTPYTGSVVYQNGIAFTADLSKLVYFDSKNNAYSFLATAWGGTIQADATGSVYGVFQIPDKTFQAGQITFLLSDISDLSQGQNAVTTQSSAIYLATPLSVQSSAAVLQVRNSTLNTQEVIQNQSIQQSTTSYNNYVTVIPPPVQPPSPYYGGDSVGNGDRDGPSGGDSGY